MGDSSVNHTIGKMHQFLAWQLPIFKKIGGRPFAYLKQNDIVVFLSGTDQYVKVLTSDGFVGTVPYFPERDHWVEYTG
jgi:hypothetical protein